MISDRRLQLVVAGLAVWAVTYARFFLGPLQEAVQSTLSLSDLEIAYIQGPALAVPMALGALFVGAVHGKIRPVRLILTFVVLSVLAGVLTSLSTTITGLVIGRSLAGLSVPGVVVPAFAYAASLYPPEQRGRAITVVTLGEILAGPAAFALGGWLLVKVGEGARDWRAAILLMTVPLFFVAALVSGLPSPDPSGGGPNQPSLAGQVTRIWAYRRILAPLLLGRVMVYLADGTVGVWGAPSFSRRFSLPPDRVGATLAGTMLLGGLVGPVAGGTLTDLCQARGGPRTTMLLLSVLCGACVPVALLILCPRMPVAYLAMDAFLILGYTGAVAALALGMVVLPSDLRPVYVALTVILGSLFFVGLAPLLVAVMARFLGGADNVIVALAIVCAATSAFGGLAFGWGRKLLPRVPLQEPA